MASEISDTNSTLTWLTAKQDFTAQISKLKYTVFGKMN
jgi:hypothetical protein